MGCMEKRRPPAFITRAKVSTPGPEGASFCSHRPRPGDGASTVGSPPGACRVPSSPCESSFPAVSFITHPLTWRLRDTQRSPSTVTFQPPPSTRIIHQCSIQGLPISPLFSLWSVTFFQAGTRPSGTDGLARGLKGHQPGAHRANEEKPQIQRVQPLARKYGIQGPDYGVVHRDANRAPSSARQQHGCTGRAGLLPAAAPLAPGWRWGLEKTTESEDGKEEGRNLPSRLISPKCKGIVVFFLQKGTLSLIFIF